MKVTYLYHSGFIIEMSKLILIFDYYKGNIKRHLNSNKDVFIFASHSHGDHYNMEIFDLAEYGDKVQYILSDDISTKPNDNIHFIAANEELNISNINIRTLQSTDLGVAFCIKAEGKTIYFAGDLNYWYWEEESNAYNSQMKKDFESAISEIKNEHFDIAFLPLDPRLGNQYTLGFDYFVRNTKTDVLVPMHMWNEYGIIDKLKSDSISITYRDKIISITGKEQEFIF